MPTTKESKFSDRRPYRPYPKPSLLREDAGRGSDLAEHLKAAPARKLKCDLGPAPKVEETSSDSSSSRDASNQSRENGQQRQTAGPITCQNKGTLQRLASE